MLTVPAQQFWWWDFPAVSWVGGSGGWTVQWLRGQQHFLGTSGQRGGRKRGFQVEEMSLMSKMFKCCFLFTLRVRFCSPVTPRKSYVYLAKPVSVLYVHLPLRSPLPLRLARVTSCLVDAADACFAGHGVLRVKFQR